MQHSRQFLLECYRNMATIRRFEDRVHDEFAAGKIPGFVHLYAGEEASAVGVCSHLGDARRDRLDPSRSRPLHRQGLRRRQGMMKEIFGRRDGLCGGKGGSMHIADLAKGMMGANGIVGGGAAADLRRGADREIPQDGRRRGGLRRRRRLQPGHDPRSLQSRQGLATARDLRRRGQRLRRGHCKLVFGRRQPGRARRRASACRATRSTASISSRSTTSRGRRSTGRATAAAPRSFMRGCTATMGHFEGDAMTYRAPEETSKLRAREGSR